LLAISGRKILSEALTDALMRLGDVNGLQRARPKYRSKLLECGYATLVGRAERDEASRKKLRPAIGPAREFAAGAFACKGYRHRAARFPDRTAACHARQDASIWRSDQHPSAKGWTKYARRRGSHVLMLNRTGKLNDSMVNRFAVREEYVNVVAALALITEVKIEGDRASDRERPVIWADRRRCKAARLSWSTTDRQ